MADKRELDDFAKRSDEIKSIKNVILHEYLNEEEGDSYVFAINAKYGDGKTKFLELFEEELVRSKDEVISINAWQDSFADDPFLSICHGFYGFFEKKAGVKIANKLKKFANKVALPTLAAGNQILATLPGLKAVTPLELVEAAKNLKEMQKKKGTNLNLFDDFKDKKSSFDGVTKLLKEYVDQKKGKTENDQPIYILIDELDRCSPKYAVNFLEIIHHFFCVKGLVFVIAIDKEQLKCYVEKIYGVKDGRFEGWYTKFIKTTYELQSIWEKALEGPDEKSEKDKLKCEYVSKKIDELFPALEVDLGPDVIESINKIVQSLDLSLRNINIFLRSLNRWYFHDESDYKRTIYEVQIAAFFIALKLSPKNGLKIDPKDPNNSQNFYEAIVNHLKKDDGIKYGYEKILELFKLEFPNLDPSITYSFAKIKNGKDIYNLFNGYGKDGYEMINLYVISDTPTPVMKSKRPDQHDRNQPATECLALTILKEIERMQNFS